MSPRASVRRRHRTSRAAKALLRVGAAGAALVVCGPAFAQSGETSSSDEAPTATAAPEFDGVGDQGIYLEAGKIGWLRRDDSITAEGAAEARYRGRILRAEELNYRGSDGVFVARGSAEIINPDGTVQYAREIELDDQLRAGVAVGFAARQDGNVKIAAATAVRRSETVHELNRAIFTSCDICDEDGRPKQPTWSIQAEKVVQDRDRQVVYYRNAVIRVLGVPVFYSPVFWHPDPQATRRSGLLVPRASLSDRRGLSYEQPVLWAISPYQDLVFSPQFNGDVNPFLNLDWRKRWWSGTVEARFGYTYEQDFGDPDLDGEDEKFGDETSRSYVLARGAFDFENGFRWGFGVEHATDKTLFDRYDINDVYETRGLYSSESRRLLSQVYAVQQTDQLYLSAALLSFQSMRFSDVDGSFPTVAPVVEARWEPEGAVLGGRVRLRGSAAALFREEDAGGLEVAPDGGLVFRPADPLRKGVDSQRASAELDWRRSFTTRGGLRVEPFLLTRADAYRVGDYGPTAEEFAVGRGYGTIGVDLRFPLLRRAGERTYTIEPMAQVALSPDADLDTRIPIEDVFAFDFDETTLFRPNKFPGFDVYEGGARLNLGVRGGVEWSPGRYARVTLGRSFRSEANQTFPTPLGLSDRSSDWVVAAAASPLPGVTGWARGRFDDNGEVRRAELAANWELDRSRGFVRYVVDNATIRIDPNSGLPTRLEELSAGGDVMLTERFGVTFRGTRDIEEGIWRRSEIGILYEDECTRAELVYERDETRLGALGPSESVFLRLNLATLGDRGYRDYDDW